jgi:hypothetical protein
VFYLMMEGLSGDASTSNALRLRPRHEYRYLGGEKGTFHAEDAYEGQLTEKEQWLVTSRVKPGMENTREVILTFTQLFTLLQTLQAAVQELGLGGDFLPILRVLSLVLLLVNLVFVDREEVRAPKEPCKRALN